jgi:hypothetical protein
MLALPNFPQAEEKNTHLESFTSQASRSFQSYFENATTKQASDGPQLDKASHDCPCPAYFSIKKLLGISEHLLSSRRLKGTL